MVLPELSAPTTPRADGSCGMPPLKGETAIPDCASIPMADSSPIILALRGGAVPLGSLLRLSGNPEHAGILSSRRSISPGIRRQRLAFTRGHAGETDNSVRHRLGVCTGHISLQPRWQARCLRYDRRRCPGRGHSRGPPPPRSFSAISTAKPPVFAHICVPRRNLRTDNPSHPSA
jgi:hypothetical protein